jgi:hypothetical protein
MFVVLTKSRDPPGSKYRLVCNIKSSFSDFLGLTTLEWFLLLICSKGFPLRKQILCCVCDVV